MGNLVRSVCAYQSRAHILCAVLAVGLLCLLAPSSTAGLFTLIDDNSSVTFNTASPSNASSWVVDGVNQLSQQAFWYRVGNTAEQSVHSLPIAFEIASNGNIDPNLDSLFVRYVGAGFRIDVRYILDGGLPGSRASDLAEQISIVNTGSAPLDFHFFQYVDFELNGTASGDSATFTNVNTVRQSEGAISVAETVNTPTASHREIDFFAGTLLKLIDGLPTTLSDTPPIGTTFGPGDVTWAYQWDFLLQPGGTFQISKDKQLSGVPEPTSLALLFIALGSSYAWRRR